MKADVPPFPVKRCTAVGSSSEGILRRQVKTLTPRCIATAKKYLYIVLGGRERERGGVVTTVLVVHPAEHLLLQPPANSSVFSHGANSSVYSPEGVWN